MAIYLDTETTGLSPDQGAAIVEVAIVDDAGRALLNTLVDPLRPIPRFASNIHGITDEMVRGKPSLEKLMPEIDKIVRSQRVVIYNARFDTPFFPNRLRDADTIECAMVRYAQVTGGRWQKLDLVSKRVGHQWSGSAHRALADAEACRSVWKWLVSKGHAPRDPEARPQQATTTVVRCPHCLQPLRVPAQKHLNVTCTACRRGFASWT